MGNQLSATWAASQSSVEAVLFANSEERRHLLEVNQVRYMTGHGFRGPQTCITHKQGFSNLEIEAHLEFAETTAACTLGATDPDETSEVRRSLEDMWKKQDDYEVKEIITACESVVHHGPACSCRYAYFQLRFSPVTFLTFHGFHVLQGCLEEGCDSLRLKVAFA
eukprot:jgi/Ulvmu1/6783/UM030_0121.1